MELNNLEINRRNGEMIISFDVSRAEIENCYGKAVSRISSSVQMPGFRKGKAPRAAVEDRYRENILSLAEEIAIDGAAEAVLAHDEVGAADILQAPRIRRKTDFRRAEPLRLEAVMLVAPEFDLAEYRGVKLKRRKAEVREAERDEELSRLAERQMMLASVERPVAKGDLVLVNSTARTKDGEVVAEFTMENGKFVIGMTRLPDEFQNSIIGMSPGEKREFTMAVPADHHIEKLGGERLEMSVELLTVKERRLPEIDDEFAASIGYKDLAELRSSIDGFLLERSKREASDQLCADLFEELRRRNPIAELPEPLLEAERRRRMASFDSTIESMGVTRERYFSETGHDEAELKTRIADESAIQVQTKLIMRAIGAKEKIEITESEVIAAVVEAAAREEQSPESMMKRLRREDGFRGIKNQCMERKILHFLLENADIEEC